MNMYLNAESPPILPLTLSWLSPCLVSNIGRGVRCVFTCKVEVDRQQEYEYELEENASYSKETYFAKYYQQILKYLLIYQSFENLPRRKPCGPEGIHWYCSPKSKDRQIKNNSRSSFLHRLKINEGKTQMNARATDSLEKLLHKRKFAHLTLLMNVRDMWQIL